MATATYCQNRSLARSRDLPALDMVENVPFVQSVLFKSPYSGCATFSGFAAVPKPGVALSPPSAQQRSAMTGNICADPTKKAYTGPKSVQPVHFRPSYPYPGYVMTMVHK